MENCLWCYFRGKFLYLQLLENEKKDCNIYSLTSGNPGGSTEVVTSLLILVFKRFSDQMAAYVHGFPIDSDTLLTCKMSGTHGRLDLSFGFSSEFSVLSLPKHKIYSQFRHVQIPF